MTICQWLANIIITSPNREGHWIARYRKNKKNRITLKKLWLIEKNRPQAPCIVHIHRKFNPSKNGKLMDEDNFIAGCKSIRDVISELLIPGLAPGQADNVKHGLVFTYEQSPDVFTGLEISFKKIEDL